MLRCQRDGAFESVRHRAVPAGVRRTAANERTAPRLGGERIVEATLKDQVEGERPMKGIEGNLFLYLKQTSLLSEGNILPG